MAVETSQKTPTQRSEKAFLLLAVLVLDEGLRDSPHVPTGVTVPVTQIRSAPEATATAAPAFSRQIASDPDWCFSPSMQMERDPNPGLDARRSRTSHA